MDAHKKDPAGFKLVAHDEAEGKPEAGRALLREVCTEAIQKGSTKEISTTMIGQVLVGQRLVTQDLLEKVMDIAEVQPDQRERASEIIATPVQVKVTPLPDPGEYAPEVLHDESQGEVLPDFSITSTPDIWRLAEYLENFCGEKSRGYVRHEQGYTAIANEIVTRAPFGLNDIASTLKILAYSTERDATTSDLLLRALEKSIDNLDTGPAAALRRMAGEMVKEPRFCTYLAKLRANPASGFVQLCERLTDISSLTIVENFDVEKLEAPRDFETELMPTPAKKVAVELPFKKKEFKHTFEALLEAPNRMDARRRITETIRAELRAQQHWLEK